MEQCGALLGALVSPLAAGSITHDIMIPQTITFALGRKQSEGYRASSAMHMEEFIFDAERFPYVQSEQVQHIDQLTPSMK